MKFASAACPCQSGASALWQVPNSYRRQPAFGGFFSISPQTSHQSDSRKYARFEQIYHTVDIAAVSASLDMCSFFALGDRKTASSTTNAQQVQEGMAAWHAVRVHHRCRLLYPPDAPLDLRTAYFTWTHLCLLDGPSFTGAQRRVAAA